MVWLGYPEWNGRGRWKTMRKVSRSSHGVVQSDPNIYASMDGEDDALDISNSSASASSSAIHDPEGSSPMTMSPWNQADRFDTIQWPSTTPTHPIPNAGLLGSLVREEGHIYSLAMADDLLYTGSDSKNIRVWRNLEEFSGFKASSGLVKAIVISGKKIFTGHQDGRIRVWKVSPRNPGSYRRSGTLPTLKDIFKSSVKPSNYVEVRRRRSSLWIKHSDAISCMSLEEHIGLLYTSSWDRTFKVWRISDSKCLESVHAHDDAVNSVLATSHCLVYTGSADGTVKLWRRETHQKSTKHLLLHQLLNQQCAVTTLAISHDPSSLLYCGSSDGLVNFWDLKFEISHAGVLRGHKLAVLCLTTSGGLMFSGSADKSICVWRRVGCVHTCVCVLSGHTGPVKCLVVKAEEDPPEVLRRRWTVYSGSLDKSVKVWSVSVGDEGRAGEPLWDSFHSRGSSDGENVGTS